MDPLPHLNQLADNVDDWDPWPQSNQDIADKDVYITDWDDNVEDGVDNLKDALENVVVGNEISDEIVNEAGNQVADGRNEVAEDGN